VLSNSTILVAIANDETATEVGASAILAGAHIVFATTGNRVRQEMALTRFCAVVMCSAMAADVSVASLKRSGAELLLYTSKPEDEWPHGCAGVRKPASVNAVIDALAFAVARAASVRTLSREGH
jgi:hypothetical protein